MKKWIIWIVLAIISSTGCVDTKTQLKNEWSKLNITCQNDKEEQRIEGIETYPYGVKKSLKIRWKEGKEGIIYGGLVGGPYKPSNRLYGNILTSFKAQIDKNMADKMKEAKNGDKFQFVSGGNIQVLVEMEKISLKICGKEVEAIFVYLSESAHTDYRGERYYVLLQNMVLAHYFSDHHAMRGSNAFKDVGQVMFNMNQTPITAN